MSWSLELELESGVGDFGRVEVKRWRREGVIGV